MKQVQLDIIQDCLMKKNKIALFNIASTIILQGLAFISGPIFSGRLGTDNYGIVAVYLTWVQITSTVFSLQAGSTVALARINFPEEDQQKYQSSVLSLATLSYAVFSVLTLFTVSFVQRWMNISVPMVIFGLFQGWGMYCVTFMNGKFTYEFKADKNFILSVSVSALTIGISIFLISRFPVDSNYWGRIIGQSGVYTVIGLGILVFMICTGKTFFHEGYWKFTLPIAVPTIFHLLAHILLNQSDKVMLQGLVSNSAAGIYALANTFGAVLNAVYSALNNSWVPFYYDYTQKNQITEMKHHANNYIELFTILTMGFILLCPEIFHLYAKPDFWKGTNLIPIFSIGYYFVFMYSFPVNYEFYNKKTKQIAIGTITAAAANIVLNYIMIRIWGIFGAVSATMIAHGLQFGFHYISAKKIKPGEFPFTLSHFFYGFFAVCGTCFLYWFTRDFWYVRWSIGIALGIYLIMKIIRRKEIF